MANWGWKVINFIFGWQKIQARKNLTRLFTNSGHKWHTNKLIMISAQFLFLFAMIFPSRIFLNFISCSFFSGEKNHQKIIRSHQKTFHCSLYGKRFSFDELNDQRRDLWGNINLHKSKIFLSPSRYRGKRNQKVPLS